MRKIPKTFTLSKSSIDAVSKAAKNEDRTASKIVDTLIAKNISKEGCCEYCNSKLTEDEFYTYKSICYKCCSNAWRIYEFAHGGECKTDIKKRHITKAIKETVLRRDGFLCLKCGSADNLTIDHITPISLGGSNDYNNLQTLCSKCNSKKSNTTADHREVVL
jgi:hypothetical protein